MTFDLRKMGDGAAFFNVTDNNKITGWFTNAQGTGTDYMNNSVFPRGFDPLFAQWQIGAPASPITSPEDLISGLYVQILGREADKEGLDYWVGELKSGAIPGRAIGRIFVESNEFKAMSTSVSDTEFINRLYRGLYGREPDTAGFNYWIGMLATQPRSAVARSFADAPEFRGTLTRIGIAW